MSLIKVKFDSWVTLIIIDYKLKFQQMLEENSQLKSLVDRLKTELNNRESSLKGFQVSGHVIICHRKEKKILELV